MSDYICHECGSKYGTPRDHDTTCCEGICAICGREMGYTGVTHRRHYGMSRRDIEEARNDLEAGKICPACGGSGTVTVWYSDEYADTEKCENCNGTGRVIEEDHDE